ncbi:hypothetical protein UFOVP860_10 [uncultured Caudovirales phage]|uniref:Uncharacterized protein n=1 Tax=uncultured Caudovirales phage TaxID=2100421 RepID=A0A6J5P658_9CAUD|nr:hypothetical protein UFOVP860_10 [uncultured Caudovirales phage]CAB4195203.1 hypothetical protein UFOVP1293_5 [uncultured Caudovirales phage]CAB4222376.1 hypothetical protein UFOVP1644_23 [uncultured Caudovirales phage]
MSGAYTARRVEAVLAAHGEDAVLSREGVGTTITLKAKRLASSEDETGGSAAQSAFKVKIGTVALAASAWADKFPKRLDKLFIGGRTRTVRDVDTKVDGGVTVMHVLAVSG